MLLRKSLFGVMGIVFACGMIAFAQEPQTQTPSAPDGNLSRDRIERMERHRERMAQHEGARGGERMGRRGAGMGHFARELNLSEAQREQSRAIIQRRLEGTKSQREELFKLREKRIGGTFTPEDEARARALHQEIRTAMQGVREEMAGVLTSEQRAKLEELKQERKTRMEQRMKERQERRLQRTNDQPM
ncbi:MAG TPA: Spy/CpxP family protein refolding chaperone [Pyrinomonadaceae bacterium]|nr:Spy/CpxP family protein refolding chaperone [Pyrinomonadaceae bacterium]